MKRERLATLVGHPRPCGDYTVSRPLHCHGFARRLGTLSSSTRIGSARRGSGIILVRYFVALAGGKCIPRTSRSLPADAVPTTTGRPGTTAHRQVQRNTEAGWNACSSCLVPEIHNQSLAILPRTDSTLAVQMNGLWERCNFERKSQLSPPVPSR